jgi:hypothetical protein
LAQGNNKTYPGSDLVFDLMRIVTVSEKIKVKAGPAVKVIILDSGDCEE